MASPVRVFLDSDVVISSLISHKGASYMLINTAYVEKVVSSISVAEITIVVKRLKLSIEKFRKLLKDFLQVINLTSHEDFSDFVLDPHDAHVVAGAKQSEAKFLVSYNIKHYKVDAIKGKLGIRVVRPSEFVQYLRLKN